MRERLMQSLSLIKKELELLRLQQKISKEVTNVSYKRYRICDHVYSFCSNQSVVQLKAVWMSRDIVKCDVCNWRRVTYCLLWSGDGEGAEEPPEVHAARTVEGHQERARPWEGGQGRHQREVQGQTRGQPASRCSRDFIPMYISYMYMNMYMYM